MAHSGKNYISFIGYNMDSSNMLFYAKDSTIEELVIKPERRPTMRALLYVVGSPCIEFLQESL